MRSRAPLSVMEQLIMVLVFALCAAVCLRCFVWAERTSQHARSCDLALVQAQSAAAVLQRSRGDLTAAAGIMGGQVEQGQWIIRYDGQWEQTDKEQVFTLQVSPQPSCRTGLMGTARIRVSGGAEELAVLEVSWQEVATHAQ